MAGRLEGSDADAWLCLSLIASRAAEARPEHYALAVAGLSAALAEAPELPVPTLAFDVALLLSGHSLNPVVVEGPLAAALRGYEDFVLARLLSDRRWLKLLEATVASPPALRPAAVGLLVARLMQRLQLRGSTVGQAAVRRLANRSLDEALAEGRHALVTRPDLLTRLNEGLESLSKQARHTQALLSDAEVFLLENVAALEGMGARVALTQLAEAAQAIEERLPGRMKPASHEGDATTALEDESAYPVGGWSSITNQGTPESMVTSELMYMDDRDRPDLFDLRFVEGELLYYARDESVALRRRRTVAVVFDASLDGVRLKDEQAQWQRLVLALGASVAAVRKLLSWLHHDALSVELCFVRSGQHTPLQVEAAVMALLFKEQAQRGRVQLREDASRAQVLERLSDGAQGRVDAVVWSVDGAAPTGAFRRGIGVQVAFTPQVRAVGKPHVSLDAQLPLDRWAEVTRQVLALLLS